MKENDRWTQNVNSFFALKKEDLMDEKGNPKYPWITFERFINDYLPSEYESENDRMIQRLYKHTLRRTVLHFKSLFPDFEIPKGENAALIAQGIKPLEQHGRPIN